MPTESHTMENTPQESMNPLSIFGRYGLMGLVIAALFYLVFDNNRNTRASLDKNSEALYQMAIALNSMKDAQINNTAAVDKLREQRK